MKKRPRAMLLNQHRSVPFLTPPAPLSAITSFQASPSPASAAAAVLVDGPTPGPWGWTSVASQDGQVRVYDTSSFFDAEPQMEKPLMLAHLLQPGESGPGQLIAHTWGSSSSSRQHDVSQEAGRKEKCHFLAILHRSGCVVHRFLSTPTSAPVPCAFLRPCADARCIDMLLSFPSSISSALTVALGGSFGLELHQVPEEGVALPTRHLPGASVSLLRFSPDGRYLAVACLDGRVGVLKVAHLLEEQQQQQEERQLQNEWACAVIKGERATCLAFSSSSDRLAVVCADGNTIMLRPPSLSSSSSSSFHSLWRCSPAFQSFLRAPLLISPPAGTSSSLCNACTTSLLTTSSSSSNDNWISGSPLPCRPYLSWSPDDNFLMITFPGVSNNKSSSSNSSSNDGGNPPRLVVLEADSGATRQVLLLPRPWQGMCGGGGGGGGGRVLGVDDLGALHVLQWKGGRAGRTRGVRQALLACTTTGDVYGLNREDQEMGEKGEEGVLEESLTLIWTKRRGDEKRKNEEQERKEMKATSTMTLRAPFFSTHACALWQKRGHEVVCFEGGRGRGLGSRWCRQPQSKCKIVIGEKWLGVSFPEVLFLHPWRDDAEKGEEKKEEEAEWQMWQGWWGSGQNLQSAAFVEGKAEGELKVLALFLSENDQHDHHHHQQQQQRISLWLELLLACGDDSSTPSSSSPAASLSVPLVLPQEEAQFKPFSWRWCILTSETKSKDNSSGSSSSSSSNDIKFVVLGWQLGTAAATVAANAPHFLHVWRGQIQRPTPPTTTATVAATTLSSAEAAAATSMIQLSSEAPLLVELPTSSALWPVALKVGGKTGWGERGEGEGGERVEFWEVDGNEEVKNGRRCWILELAASPTEEDEEEAQGDDEEDLEQEPAFWWRVARRHSTSRMSSSSNGSTNDNSSMPLH